LGCAFILGTCLALKYSDKKGIQMGIVADPNREILNWFVAPFISWVYGVDLKGAVFF
jgi:hypothetical protein